MQKVGFDTAKNEPSEVSEKLKNLGGEREDDRSNPPPPLTRSIGRRGVPK